MAIEQLILHRGKTLAIVLQSTPAKQSNNERLRVIVTIKKNTYNPRFAIALLFIHIMGVLGFVRLALSSVSVFIGCRSFAFPTTTTRLGSSHLSRHPVRFRSPFLSPAALPTSVIISTRTPSTHTLRSSTATATDGGDDIGFVSDGVDADADADAYADIINADIDEGNCDDGTDKALGLYIHIPYCRQRCRYCDFAIVPIGDHGTKKVGASDTVDLGVVGENSDQDDPDQHSKQEDRREQGFLRMNDRYVSAVVAELKQIAVQNTNTKNNCQKVPLRSIYFGGGTPSLAPIKSIENILYHACGIDNPEAPFHLLQQSQPSLENTGDGTNTNNNPIVQTEITMEMDPGTFDREYLSSLRDLGINRVSLGVQSFDDDLLRAMGRTHRRADVLQAIQDIAFVFGSNNAKDYKSSDDNGWENVNYSIDLISGCPGLTPAKWVETLQEATIGVKTKKETSTKTILDSTLTTTKERRSMLLSSLPPPKHISVYDMQIEEGTVFGKWAAKAKEAADAKRKENELSNTPYVDEEDEDEDPSRQFTVAVPLNESGKASGRPSRESNPKQKPNQEQRLLRLPSEEECAFMYKYAAGYLRAKNYEHYEVSSYAAFNDPVVKIKKGRNDDGGNRNKQRIGPTSRRSVHNQIYWEYGGQWYAVGLGATSFVDKKLVPRPREMDDYVEWVHENKEHMASTTNEEDGEEGEDDDDDEDFLSDILLKRLRTTDGLDLNWLKSNYGSETVKGVLEGAKLGLELELAEHTDGNILRLMDPDG